MVIKLSSANNADPPLESHRLSEDIDSTCSTPYVSAPSSPGRNPSGYFFSAPASPMHYVLSSSKSSATPFCDNNSVLTTEGSFEFEFSSRFSHTNNNSSENIGSMTSADELFLNGQIRPMKLSSHLQRPQRLTPLLDLDDGEDDDVSNSEVVEITRGRDLRSRNRSLHRKARSLSPFRGHEYSREPIIFNDDKYINEIYETEAPFQSSIETTPSVSACSSRSSSSGRNSKKWIFLKDLLYRSKSEGRGNSKEKYFWSSLYFSQSVREKKLVSPSLTPSSSRDEKQKVRNTKEKKIVSPSLTPSSSRDEKNKVGNTKEKKLFSNDKEKGINLKGKKQGMAKKSGGGGKPMNGVSKRRVALSAHELHYTANRAQAEEMKKKTSLPYRQGLFGCLSFSSKSYGAFSVFTRSLNPVSSR